MAVSDYCDTFILLDLRTQETLAEFPVKQFGFCHSARYALDGVLFSFVSFEGAGIFYLGEKGLQKVYSGNFDAYDLGPFLYRLEDAVVFSYQDDSKPSFGVQKINSTFEVTPLLSFSPDQVDFVSDTFTASDTHYVYTVDQENKLTFYLAALDKEPIQIPLPEGEKLFSYALTEKALIVSKDVPGIGGGFFIECFDLNGESIAQYQTDEHLYRLTAQENGLFYGFVSKVVEAFQFSHEIESLVWDTSTIESSFLYALSNGGKTLLISYDFPHPQLWLLSH